MREILKETASTSQGLTLPSLEGNCPRSICLVSGGEQFFPPKIRSYPAPPQAALKRLVTGSSPRSQSQAHDSDSISVFAFLRWT